MDATCPNCGDDLLDYRTDRQSTGGREVILSWTMCTGCRHVGLKKWMVAHPENVRHQRSSRNAVGDRSPSRRSVTG